MMKRCWIVLVFTLMIAGCGYTTGSLLPSSIKTISVLPFKNSMGHDQKGIVNYVPLMEVKVRESIVDRFLFDGHLRVVKEETADLVLKGELKGFERQELRVSDNQDVIEFRIHIMVDLTLWDPVEQKVVWSESNFTGEATYFVTGPLAKPESSAIEEALKDISRRVVERTLEDW